MALTSAASLNPYKRTVWCKDGQFTSSTDRSFTVLTACPLFHFHLQLFNSLYKNNENLSKSPEMDPDPEPDPAPRMVPVDGMYDCMMYIGKCW